MGKECSLLLKHSKGKVIATLQCTTQSTPSALFSSTSLSPSAKRKKKKKGSKKRKLEKLLAYHQRLVVEKGLHRPAGSWKSTLLSPLFPLSRALAPRRLNVTN